MDTDNISFSGEDLPHYDFDSDPTVESKPLKNKPESSMEKAAKKLPPMKIKIVHKGDVEFEKALKAAVKEMVDTGEPDLLTIAPKPTITPMAERYRKAWKVVYKKQKEWRQHEIDNQLKTGSLSDKSWDTAFVMQIIELAESDNKLENF